MVCDVSPPESWARLVPYDSASPFDPAAELRVYGKDVALVVREGACGTDRDKQRPALDVGGAHAEALQETLVHDRLVRLSHVAAASTRSHAVRNILVLHGPR